MEENSHPFPLIEDLLTHPVVQSQYPGLMGLLLVAPFRCSNCPRSGPLPCRFGYPFLPSAAAAAVDDDD